MPRLTETISIEDDEIEYSAIRASGPGGQNVNKVASAIHLRFDIRASSLPEDCKARLLALRDRRINNAGVLVIKAERFRTREKNLEDALQRLADLVRRAEGTPRRRIATSPGRGAKARRMDSKRKRGQLKTLRRKVDF